MNVTGQQFEMDLKTFTLGNMFAMQLQQHAAAIASITSGAVKELTIESELKKMADVWKEQRFDLHKYTHVSYYLLIPCYSHIFSAFEAAVHPIRKRNSV
jgi:hypothetical protein